MKAIMPQLNKDSQESLYIQLYEYIKEGIITNDIQGEEKLPSIRKLADELGVSVTTTNLAYQQLLVEGYISSRPQSGYYVNNIGNTNEKIRNDNRERKNSNQISPIDYYKEAPIDQLMEKSDKKLYYDENTFDFVKWKKCLNRVLNEHAHLLLHEGEPQGEYVLRYEISQYLYRSRGVRTKPSNIIIGAGTQQIAGQLSSLLILDGVSDLVLESPGYSPIHRIFNDFGLETTMIPVGKDGIKLEDIPQSQRYAVYTSPSNQFPTGALMPVGKRYELLDMIEKTDSYIIEDDYDSELRYFGRPIPPIQSLDKNDRVIYLSSFSSTLFPAIKISYIVLPDKLSKIFSQQKTQYTQTCSKTEQLTLAYYMREGFYQTNIKKLRRLYAQKLRDTITSIKKYSNNKIKLLHSSSGINMLIEVNSHKDGDLLSNEAGAIGVSALPVPAPMLNNSHDPKLILHFHQIPADKIDEVIKSLLSTWDMD